MSAETWRVVCEGGEVRRPDVGSVGDGDYVAMTGEPDDEHVGDGTTQRAAILDLCRVAGWDATELVAPGAQTAAERLAEVTAERDALREELDAAHARSARWQDERDAAVAARDALAGAVSGLFAAQAAASMPVEAHDLPALLLDFVAGVPADDGMIAAGRALVDARAALNAALAAAGGGL